MDNELWLSRSLIIVALVLGLLGGYFYGSRVGYTTGYKQAEIDAKKVAEEAAKKAVEAAAKAANPFQSVNPLEGVESNPFEKAKKVLNPFQ
ncbi:MAG: hypothetical protein HZA94_02485 [Candidatus Vogelbacteria bacterium]|nr:hypothetical protein [Candidatus Vogelbacteria bacterium]